MKSAPSACSAFPCEDAKARARAFAHARTPFKDGATPETRRHLIRLWNRDEGQRTFHG